MKSKYITPEITVVEFKVEAGFATSGEEPVNENQFDASGSTGLSWSSQDLSIEWNN